MIAPVPATPNAVATVTGMIGSGRALAADLFAAILGRQAAPVAGNDAGDRDAPDDGGKAPECDTLDAVLAFIAQAIGAPVPPTTATPSTSAPTADAAKPAVAPEGSTVPAGPASIAMPVITAEGGTPTADAGKPAAAPPQGSTVTAGAATIVMPVIIAEGRTPTADAGKPAAAPPQGSTVTAGAATIVMPVIIAEGRTPTADAGKPAAAPEGSTVTSGPAPVAMPVITAEGGTPPPAASASEPAADIATLLRRIREWADSPTVGEDAASARRTAKTETVTPIPSAPLSVQADPLPAFTAPATTQRATEAPADPTQPAESAAKIIERHLDLAKDGQWLDRLARDIAMSAGHSARMKFQLNPEHLGALHVEIAQGAEGASIRLTTETEAARAILANAEPRLAAEARAQGLRIAEAHIDLGGQGANGQGAGAQQQARPQVRTANLSEHPLAVVARSALTAERFA